MQCPHWDKKAGTTKFGFRMVDVTAARALLSEMVRQNAQRVKLRRCGCAGFRPSGTTTVSLTLWPVKHGRILSQAIRTSRVRAGVKLPDRIQKCNPNNTENLINKLGKSLLAALLPFDGGRDHVCTGRSGTTVQLGELESDLFTMVEAGGTVSLPLLP